MSKNLPRESDAIEWLGAQEPSDVAAMPSEHEPVSYEHPYGFTVIRLQAELLAGWQIRIHLWPPRMMQVERMRTNRTLDQQVHSHGWLICSRVMTGAVDERSYQIIDDETSHLGLYSVASSYGVGVSELRLDRPGVTAVQTHQATRSSTSGPCLISSGLFHTSTSAADAWSVTLVAMEVVDHRRSSLVAPTALGGARTNERKSSNDLSMLASLLAQAEQVPRPQPT